MNKLLLFLILLVNCAAPSYRGEITTIQITERVDHYWAKDNGMSFSDRFTKVIIVDNPYIHAIRVTLDCGWEGLWELNIGPKSSRYVLTRPQRWKIYAKTCYITEWSFIPSDY